ncbi:MAG: hypothetical protein JWQ35_2006, partial [Bacteriovoracaceae bacterium]|nr:hypothetical protein [Bacteriovoracaceae bacterium]
MVSIVLSAAVAGGFLYGLKKFTALQKVEGIKTSLLERHRSAQEMMGKDLKQAFKITGSTTSLYYPVSRIASDANTLFNPQDAFDGISIYKDAYPEIYGAVQVRPPNGTNYFSVYYVSAGTPTQNGGPSESGGSSSSLSNDQDNFFKMAFLHKRYFFLSNGSYRNIIENLDYKTNGAASSQNPVTCPVCAVEN